MKRNRTPPLFDYENLPMGPAEIAAMIVCYAIVIVPLVACLYFTFAGG